MPLPTRFSEAQLVIGGQSYRLVNVAVTSNEVSYEREPVYGAGRIRGFTQGRTTERVSIEAELFEAPSRIDPRDATLSAAFNAPLRVTPAQASLSAGTFSNEPPAEPITMASMQEAARSIQRDQDADQTARLMGSLADIPGMTDAGSRELQSDAALRQRLLGRLMSGAYSGIPMTIQSATGEALDRLAETYGLTREEHPMLVFKEGEPLKSALDWILEDEGEAA